MPASGTSEGEGADLPAVERRFRIVGCVLLAVNLCAISLGDGEFWPFSKFPMFARAGRSWKRSIVREVSVEDLQRPLVEVWEKELPGEPVALHHFQINQDDLSAVVRSLTQPLSDEQATLLAQYFDRLRHEKTMVLYAAFGRFRSDRSVRVRFLPLAVIGPDGVRDVPPVDVADAGAPMATQPDAGQADASGAPALDAGVQP
jgi:hypothetical protein